MNSEKSWIDINLQLKKWKRYLEVSLVERSKPTESLRRPHDSIAPFSDLISVPVIPRVYPRRPLCCITHST